MMGTYVTIFFVVVGLMIVLGIWAAIETGKNKDRLLAALKADLTKFNPQHLYAANDGNTAIGVDTTSKAIGVVALGSVARILPYRDLLSSELVQDEHSITKSSSGVGRAIAGGLMFGGAGAVVGAVTGSTTTKGKIRRIDLHLTINDVNHPIFPVNFLNTEVDEGGYLHTSALKCAQEWAARFKAVIAQAEQEPQLTAIDSMPAAPIALAPADEMKKWENMFAKGLVSRAELDARKAALSRSPQS